MGVNLGKPTLLIPNKDFFKRSHTVTYEKD